MILVISVIVGNYIIRKVLVDQGSLRVHLAKNANIPESSLSPYNEDLVGYYGEWVNILGVIELRITFETKSNVKTIDVRYLVIDS